MFRLRPFLSITALGTLVALLGCGTRTTSTAGRSPSSAPPTPSVSEHAIRVWTDKEAEDVARILGNDAVVFRWEHGVAEGWVKFDTDSDPQMTPLDFGRTWYQRVMTEEGGTKPTAGRFSGMAIVSEKRLSHDDVTNDEFEWREYAIHLVTTWKARYQDRTMSMTDGPFNGRVRFPKGKPASSEGNSPDSKETIVASGAWQPVHRSIFGSSSGGDVIQLAKRSSNDDISEEVPWLELRVVDPAK